LPFRCALDLKQTFLQSGRSDPKATWAELPPEVLGSVYRLLDGPSLASAGSVCRSWRHEADSESLWESLAISEGLSTDRAERRPQEAEDAETKGRSSKGRYARWLMLQRRWKEGRHATSAVRVHSHNVECIELVDGSPAGPLMLTASWDGSLCVVRRSDWRVLLHAAGHSGWVTCMAVQLGGGGGAGLTVVTGGTDGQLLVWELGSASWREPPRRLPHEAAAVTCTAFAGGLRPRDRHRQGIVVSGADDCLARVWDTASGTCLAALAGHSAVVWGLCALGGPRMRVATSSRDGTARLWDLAGSDGRTWRPRDGQPLRGIAAAEVCRKHSAAVLSMDATVVAAEDPRFFATGGADGLCALWDSATGECRTTFTGHSHGVHCVKLASFRNLLPEEERYAAGDPSMPPAHLASGSQDCTVRIWCTRSGQCLAELRDHQNPVVAISCCGSVIVSLAPGDGALAYYCEGSQAQGRTSSSGGRLMARTRAARLRQQVTEARAATESGFRNILSLMEGAALSFQAAVRTNSTCLVLGSRTGDVLVLDYGASL